MLISSESGFYGVVQLCSGDTVPGSDLDAAADYGAFLKWLMLPCLLH